MTFKCHILVPQSQSVYLTGDTVKGVAEIIVKDKARRFKKVSIKLKGEGKLQVLDKWQRRKKTYYGFDKYEDVPNILEETNNDLLLNPGTYRLPFKLTIPDDIPPSFGVVRNRGRYKINCRIKHQIHVLFESYGVIKKTKTFKEEIFVIAGVQPRLSSPLIYGNRKNVYGFNCKKGVISIKAFIEESILKPGDKVKFSYEATNNSSVNILNIRVKLVEAYTFTYSKTDVNVMNKTSDLVFKSVKVMRRSAHSESFEMDLPKLGFSVDFSKVLRRDYHIHISVVLPCLRRTLILQIPVLVNAKSDEGIANLSNKNFITNVKDIVKRYEKLNSSKLIK